MFRFTRQSLARCASLAVLAACGAAYAVPQNDTCESAVNLLNVLPYSDTVLASDATDDIGYDLPCDLYPDVQSGVWYQLTPTVRTEVTISQTNSSLTQAVVSVWSGDCSLLEIVACSEFSSGPFNSNNVQRYPMNAGQSYYLLVSNMVDNVPAGQSYQVSVTGTPFPTALPPNDDCSAPTAIPPAATTFSTGEVNFSNPLDDLAITCDANFENVSRNGVWYTFSPATDRLISISNTIATEPPLAIAMFTGDCSSPSTEACGVLTPTRTTATFIAEAGKAYRFLVARGGSEFDAASPSDVYNLTWTFQDLPSPPANDTCGTATVISAVPYSGTAAIGGATRDAEVTTCDDFANLGGRRGVWYTYTAGFTGNLAIRTTTSPYRVPVITVYTGTDCSSKTFNVCGGANNGIVFVPVTSGTTYFVQVSSRDVASAPMAVADEVTLILERVIDLTHDLCENAIPITSYPFTSLYNNDPALPNSSSGTPESGVRPPGAAFRRLIRSVYYTLTTGPNGGALTVSHKHYTSSGMILLFSLTGGNSCVSLTDPIATSVTESSPDNGLIATNNLTATLAPNTTYIIVTGQDFGARGGYNSLQVNVTPPCIADFDNSGAANIDDIFIFLNAWFAGCNGTQSGAPCFNRTTDTNGDGVTIDDIFIFLNRWFAGC